MQVLFSINEYDKDGDVIEPGIFLHFGWTRVKVASNMAEFRRVVESISNMPAEIQENYPDVPQGQPASEQGEEHPLTHDLDPEGQ